ncbi:MAG: hypothetical protein WD904_09830 [Dehalococcoidia bacterium]
MIRKHIGFGGMVMLLVIVLGAIGFGYALWSKVLTIEGVVRTGSVNAEFIRVFTDDDDFVDDSNFDSQDTGDCLISVGPDQSPFENDKDPTDGVTSCDPSATGRDPKPHYDKDVARCDAIAVDEEQDGEPQPGSQRARLAILNGYPSYHCTAWFGIVNNGTIPVLLHHILIDGAAVVPCGTGASTPYDLSGDGLPDIEICLSGVPTDGERQIDPRDEFVFDLDIHVMQTAPQGASLEFSAQACLHQWNEETGNCPENVLDKIIDADGLVSEQSGDPAFREVTAGDVLSTWPAGDPDNAGIDWFDQDGNGAWTFNSDDIHMEGASTDCPTGIRDAVHQVPDDCVVLDVNNDLANGDLVDCDLEGQIAFTACDPLVKWHDLNGDGDWDPGEDIVLDVNNNGIFD